METLNHNRQQVLTAFWMLLGLLGVSGVVGLVILRLIA